MQRFADRADAGRHLAERLAHYADDQGTVVLALPRGGVPVGFEVARALGVPLDVFMVRKLGVPGQTELAMGAIATGGVRVLNDDVITMLNIPKRVIDKVTAYERQELSRREQAYRGDRPPLDLRDKTVILVDDGLATGSTMLAAARAAKAAKPRKIIVAVPVAAGQTCDRLAAEADEVVCAMTPEPFYAVGQWYENFSQTTDGEVRELLDQITDEPPPEMKQQPYAARP